VYFFNPVTSLAQLIKSGQGNSPKGLNMNSPG